MLKRFLDSKCIMINDTINDKEELLKKMINQAQEKGYLSKDNSFYEDILEKEKTVVMELSPHIVLPHFRAEYINKLFVIMAINKDGLKYKGASKNKAQIVVMVGVPKQGNEYLKLLASISRLMLREDFRQDILSAELPADVVFAIKKCEVQIDRTEDVHIKKYFVILTLNKSFSEDKVLPLLTEVGMELPVEIEGINLDNTSVFMPLLRTFGVSSGHNKYTKTYFGLSDEKDAAPRLFSLLKGIDIDLNENGMGSLVQIEAMESYGGYAPDMDF